VKISRLGEDHVREAFDSGVAPLDEFLRRYARQNDERGISRTCVATRAGGREVLGHVTLRVGHVVCEQLPPTERDRLPRYPVPVLHVARLAVDRRVRGQGLGEDLLLFALRKAVDATEAVGIRGVEVIAKDQAARGFYLRYGFRPLVDDRFHLYISLKTVRRAL
jgi:ribosomal protein S18 acetylase RimI-like enzyme